MVLCPSCVKGLLYIPKDTDEVTRTIAIVSTITNAIINDLLSFNILCL